MYQSIMSFETLHWNMTILNSFTCRNNNKSAVERNKNSAFLNIENMCISLIF